MQMVCAAWVASGEEVATRDARLSPVFVAQAFQGRNTDSSFIKVVHGDSDVQDWLGEHAWNGRTSYMADPDYVLANRRQQPRLFLVKQPGPFGCVVLKPDGPSFQSNHTIPWVWHPALEGLVPASAFAFLTQPISRWSITVSQRQSVCEQPCFSFQLGIQLV
jgi:hypothetical protein